MTTLTQTRGPAGDTSLGDLVSALAQAPVTSSARDVAQVRLADTAFATAIGLRTEQGRRSAALATELHGPDSPAGRAFRLCAAVRMTEIDDVDLLSCITPGSIVIPAVLAALPLSDVGFQEALDAIVRGYEVALGLGEAMQGPRRLALGVWPSLAAGAVVAAVTTTLLLGGSSEDAAALAAQQSVHGNPRGNARENLLATAVVTGVASALAVRHGFSVATGTDGGALGRLLVEPVSTGPSAQRILRPAMKSFCSARQVMTSVSALRDIVAQTPLRPEEIDRIDVWVPSAYSSMIDKPTVGSRRESLSSAQYQLALQVCDPAALQDVGRETLRADAAFRSVMAAVRVQADPDLSASYPAQWPARIRVTAGASTYYGQADEVPGEADHSIEALAGKVARFARTAPHAHLISTQALQASGPADLVGLAAAIDRELWERSA